jgi:hypothetical protein
VGAGLTSLTERSLPSRRVGNIISSTNPAGGAQAWSLDALVSGESILGASCPSTSLCVASCWNQLSCAE